MERNGKKLKVLQDGHPRRMSDGKNAWRKMTTEQRLEFLAWAYPDVALPVRRAVHHALALEKPGYTVVGLRDGETVFGFYRGDTLLESLERCQREDGQDGSVQLVAVMEGDHGGVWFASGETYLLEEIEEREADMAAALEAEENMSAAKEIWGTLTKAQSHGQYWFSALEDAERFAWRIWSRYATRAHYPLLEPDGTGWWVSVPAPEEGE
tara:strand:+ start:292 stop:921 length:630 start_codon:yes stop_codon:yes gene_type:complete